MAADTLETSQKVKAWVVVADGKTMNVYNCLRVKKAIPMGGTTKHTYQDEQWGWELSALPEMTMQAEPSADFQTGHDHRGSSLGRGMSSGPTAAAMHTLEPNIDVREEIRDQFAHAIALKLTEACKGNAFDRLVLVTPPRMLGKIKQSIDDSLAKRIAAEVPKELTHCKSHELLTHIKDALSSLYAA